MCTVKLPVRSSHTAVLPQDCRIIYFQVLHRTYSASQTTAEPNFILTASQYAHSLEE